MLRISRSNLARAWIAIKEVARGPDGLQGAWDRARMNATDQDDRILNEASEGEGALGELEGLFRNLVLATDTYDDGKVIEDLLEVVNRSYARNRIDSRTFELIKAALMTPGDHAKLAAALQKDEGHCGHCGHVFVDYEIAVYKVEQINPGRRGFAVAHQPTWYCSRCVHPDFHACNVTDCNGQVQLNQKARSVLTNTNLKCPVHQAEAIEEFRKTGKEAKLQEGAQFGPVAAAPPEILRPDRLADHVRFRQRLVPTVDAVIIDWDPPRRGPR